MGRKRSKATLSSFGNGFPSGNHVANVSRRQNMQNWNTQCLSSPGTHTPCCPGGLSWQENGICSEGPHSISCSPHQQRHQLVVLTKVFGAVNFLHFPDVDNRPGKSGLRK